jgi:hypothetical protein
VTTVVVIIAIVAVGAFITALIAAGMAIRKMDDFLEDVEE